MATKKSTKRKKPTKAAYTWAVTRLALGFVFLWAFFDKLLGLGFATCRAEDDTVEVLCDSAWAMGGSPTTGFLKFGTKGSPFEEVFAEMAGNAFWDWLFMAGLFGIGLALVLGIGMRIATYSGALLMFLMYLAVLPLDNNPLIDDHIVYALVLLGLWQVNDDQVLGYGKQWEKLDIVKKYPVLK